jgi:VCBS repeat-containing protein
MHTIHTLLLGLILLFSLTACGSDNTSDKAKESNIIKSAEGIISAGDDQEVLEGTDVSLSASILDKDKTVQTITWKEDGKILGEGENLKTGSLSKGTHTITLEIIDTQGNHYQDQVSITVKEPSPTNTPPHAKDLSITLDEDSISSKQALIGSDQDGDKLSYLIISYPKHGTLSGSYARVQYRPNKDYFGTDSFTYKTNDGMIDSNLATVSIMINPVNDAPIFQKTARDQTINVGETRIIYTAVFDRDQDSIHYTITPSWISCSKEGTLSITATKEHIGTHHVRLQADDNHGGISNFEFDLHVENRAVLTEKVSILPIDTISISENDKNYVGRFHIEGEDNQSNPQYNGKNIIYTVSDYPTGFHHGQTNQFSLDLSSYQYLKKDENITYTIRVSAHVDGLEDDKREFNITILGKNDAPIFSSYPAFPVATEDSYYEVDLIEALHITDPDNSADELHFKAINLPFWLTLKDSQLIGTPTNDATLKSFPATTIIVDDGIETITYGESIKVLNTNDAPIAKDDFATTDADSTISLNILSNDNDVDKEDSISLKEAYIVSNKGQITFDKDGNITYSPIGYFDSLEKNKEENVTLSYTIQDEHNATSSAKVTISVKGKYVASPSDSDNITTDTNNTMFDTPTTLDTKFAEAIPWIELVDLDKDKDLDLVIQAEGKGLYWYENENGTFKTKHIVKETNSTIIVSRVFDLNGDGFPDIIYAYNDMTICINEQNNNFTCREPIYSGKRDDDGIQSIAVSDVDGDNLVDILTTSYYEKTVNIFKQDGANSFSYNENLSNKLEGSIAFFNSNKNTPQNNVFTINIKDSYTIVANEPDIMHLYENQNNGTFNPLETDNLTATNPIELSFTQLDQDTQPNILGASSDGELFWYNISNDEKHTITTLSESIPYLTSADIDGDNAIDILTNTSAGEIIWFKNNKETTPTFSKYIIDTKQDIMISKIADIDKDGDNDVISADQQGKIYIYKNRRN